MRLVTYNIQYSLGKDGRYDLSRIAEAIDGADIIALQEVERGWRRTSHADQPRELAGLLGQRYFWVYGPAFDIDRSTRNPDGTVTNRRRQFGPMLLSRTPILSSRLHLLPKLESLSHLNFDTGALEAVIDSVCGALRVYSLHLGYLSRRERLLQIDTLHEIQHRSQSTGGAWCGPDAAIEEWGEGEPPPPEPVHTVMMGDFNAEPDTSEYEQLAGERNPRVGRVVHADRFIDVWRAVAGHDQACVTQQKGMQPDPSHDRRVDYCFVSPGLKSRIKDAWVDTDALGSDHQPCWFEIDL